MSRSESFLSHVARRVYGWSRSRSSRPGAPYCPLLLERLEERRVLAGEFTDISAGLTGVTSSSVAWGDYDQDGDLDFLLTGNAGSGNRISRVYQNTSGTFSDISAGLTGVFDSSVAWGDYDRDGDLDFLLTGQDSGGNPISRVYRNTSGTFSDISAGLIGVFDTSVAWGDYDQDGDLDILLTGNAGSGNFISRVYKNTSGTFSDISAGLIGVDNSSVGWGDYDNDGDLDILLTGGDSGGIYISRVYRNTSGTFSNLSAGLTGVFNGSVAWGDYDNDGDLDILLTGRVGNSNYISRVYRNTSATANTTPAAPSGLLAAANGPTSINLSWTAPNDSQTPSAGLNYNLRVGTTPGGSNVVAPMSFTSPNGLRKIAQRGLVQGTSWTLKNLTPGQTYYWSVQAIDTALAGGPFATEQSFSTPLVGDKIGIHRSNQFYQDVNGNGVWNGNAGGDRLQTFGIQGDIPLVGDWNGDGFDKIGVKRGNQYYLDANGNGIWNGTAGGDQYFVFGNPNDVPLTGDWDGDGDDQIGVQRGNQFFLDRNGNGVWNGAAGGDLFHTFGNPGDTPLAGDWDGDGDDQIGIHRGSQFFLDRNSNGVWNGTAGGDRLFNFGATGDVPIIGDWNANGSDEIGVRRGNQFYRDNNGNGVWNGTAGGDLLHTFGNPGDRPIDGKWRPIGAVLAAGGTASSSFIATPLTRDELSPILEQALVLWADTGLTSSQLQALRAVPVGIADLPGAQLGLSLGGSILLDTDAAGYGWFVDPTPDDNSEFSNSLLPNPQSLDLLTVVLHELGHELGFDHDDDFAAMFETLAVGTRRLL